MTRTSAVTFSQKIKPFSEQFNRDMRDVIVDLQAMLQYLQPLQHLIARGDVAGEGGGSGSFPAQITENMGNGLYVVKEVLKLPETTILGAESRKGVACNLAELTGPSTNPELNGTGITVECLDEIVSIGGTIDVEKILLNIVACHEYTPVKPDEDERGSLATTRGSEETPDFFFHHMLPFCVSCAGIPDDGGEGEGEGEGEGGDGDGLQRTMTGGY